MKFLRNLLPIAVVALGFSSSAAYAACSHEPFHNTNKQRDFEAVQEFVNSKRTISLEEKTSNLSIAGDIRFDWGHIIEKVHGHKLRGRNGTAVQTAVGVIDTAELPPGAPIPKGSHFSPNAFDVEFNLYFDYVCDRAWGVAWLQFNENAGIEHHWRGCVTDPDALFGSGCCEDLCLRKAYFGYNIFADGCSRFDVEIGRRPLYTIFDSRIQFQARFDGVLLRYNRQIECWGDFYWNLGGFLVDERADHYAYVTEVGLMNIYDYGFDVKYSFIDWKSALSHDTNRCGTKHPKGVDYRVSQVSLAYSFNPEYLCMPTKIYTAFIWNSSAKKVILPDTGKSAGKQNFAWYLGFIIGEVCHEGDWSFDMNYQECQAQAVPDQDFGGIGAYGDNLLGDTWTGNRRGFTNYKGWRFEGVYALTDNLSIDTVLEFRQQYKKQIAGRQSYSKFEIQAIYAF